MKIRFCQETKFRLLLANQQEFQPQSTRNPAVPFCKMINSGNSSLPSRLLLFLPPTNLWERQHTHRLIVGLVIESIFSNPGWRINQSEKPKEIQCMKYNREMIRWLTRSCFPSSENGGASDTVDTEGEGAHAEVAVVAPAHLLHIPEPTGHVGLQLIVHLLLVPHETLNVLNKPQEQQQLHASVSCLTWLLYIFTLNLAQGDCAVTYLNPLEVAHCDTTGVREDVWKNENAFLGQDLQKEFREKAFQTNGTFCCCWGICLPDTVRCACLICLRVCGVVCSLNDVLCFDLICVVPRKTWCGLITVCKQVCRCRKAST